ncbi:MAG TPA: DUF1080 domain-containing protein [Bryobacteraceae bacterium]|jgi:Domain of Unknown Function (DUF1080)|nr:DUF1080 domain-containing protein [Bryobacteraceae bacterium]
MKRIVVALAVMAVCAAIAISAGMPNTLTGKEKSEGWKLLFDGKSLDQWDLSTSPKAQWKVVDGAIVTDSTQGGTLLSKEDFANFELKVEFRTTDNVNSGVMLRNPRPDASKKGGGAEGYEVQIRDKNPGHYTGGSYLTGSLVNVEKAPADVKIVSGEWTPLDITADGDHFVILYNGRKVVDAHDTKLESGAIGLQWAHPEDAPGTKVEFRNIKVRRLK